MGRPRKAPEDRLSRGITARLSDDQYQWLIKRIDEDAPGLSESLRDAIDLAQVFELILLSPDPVKALRKVLKEGEREAAREAYRDEWGEYPPE
jgi:hypothetical protein